MKKALVIAPYAYLPYFSGGQKSIAHFLEWLGKEIDLTVISVAKNDFSLAGSYKGLGLLKNSKSRYIDRSLVKKISALVSEQGYDTLICEHPYFAWLVFAIRKKTGIKVIMHTHNIEYQRFRSTGRWWWPIMKLYERRAFRKADWVLFISAEDREFAITNWGIDASKCIGLTFGIDRSAFPVDRPVSRNKIALLHGIKENEKILLFAGLLNYKPNEDAVRLIADEIDPLLAADTEFRYKILICGKGLDPEIIRSRPAIIYAGFVEDIEIYFKGSDIFLNPVQSGGGIKTKLIEAVAEGTTVVSTLSGAAGVVKESCGEKLVVIPDNDWNSFAANTIKHASLKVETPARFYDFYHWPNQIKRAVKKLSGESTSKN